MVVEITSLDYVYTSLDNLNHHQKKFYKSFTYYHLNIYIHIYIHINNIKFSINILLLVQLKLNLYKSVNMKIKQVHTVIKK